MSNHGHYYSAGPPPSQSPFYAQQHHQHHGGPPPSSQQPQHQSPYGQNNATSPVSNYSNSPPQQQPPPIRPHTTAPYSAGGYAPPSATAPGGGYYSQQPPSHQPQPAPAPSPQGPYRTQQGRPDFSPPQQPQQPQQRQEYTPTSGRGYSPDLPNIIANTHNLPPDVVQRLAEDLMRSIQYKQQPGGGGVAPPSGAPLLSQPIAPYGQQRQGSPVIAAAPMAPPPPPQGPHGHQPHHQQVPNIPGAFPSYAPGPGPVVQEAAPAPAPAPPHHSHQQRPSQSQHYGPPSGQSYFPPQQTPTSATGPPHQSPKGPPAMAMRDDGLGRKASHRQSKSTTTSAYGITPATSASSAASGKPKMTMDDGAIFYELWGDLVDKEPGREPRPREKLVNLLRETANYMIKERPVKESIVITPEKMVDFYTCNAVEKEPLNWTAFFTGRSLSSLSSIYRALNCEHFYIPPASDQKPCIPALTPRGFETWMFTQLMSDPNREAARIQKVVSSWAVMDKLGRPFPKSIPRRCFPEKEDQIICDGWWRVFEEFPPDFDEESEEETLALPAPGSHHYGPPRDQMTPPEAAEGPFVPTGHRKKVPMTMPYTEDDEEDRHHSRKDSKPKAPIRKQYADPSWREEPNPRPTLGEEPKGTRSNPPPRPHTSHGHHPSVDAAEKPRSRQRDRSEYRHRHQSRHRSRHRRERSPSVDRDGDWSGSSGISARTPGSPDGPPDASAPAPAPPPGAIPLPGGISGDESRRPKRLEDVDRVQREQHELLRKFEKQRYPENTYPDDFEEYRHPRERERERDDRRVAEYAYQDEFERDRRRSSAGGGPGANGGGSAPGDSRRSHHGGSGPRRDGDRAYYGRP